MSTVQKKELPRLSYGEGTMSWHGDKIMYRKSVKVGGGTKRLSVYGGTVREVKAKMREAESKALSVVCSSPTTTLSADMKNWLKAWKAPVLKPSSYDRLETTFKCQIEHYPIASIRWGDVASHDIQMHLNSLVEKKLSYSTIKKVYDLFNNYYNWKVKNRTIKYSPMETVIMTSEENMLKPTKQIQYLTKDEIPVFIEEATRLQKQMNTPVYRLGQGFVFLLFTGLRAGEAVALQWADIDFEKKTVTINKNSGIIVNREYDANSPELMKKQGIKKRVHHTGSTKNTKIRVVSLNTNAMEAINELHNQSKFVAATDYVFCTKAGKQNTQTNLDRCLKNILRNTDLSVQKCGCHMLRHTCASLLFEKNISVELIAAILGHSAAVCRKTYIHFCQKQTAEAIHKIAEFNF